MVDSEFRGFENSNDARMQLKILVLTGSPHLKGTTAYLADEFWLVYWRYIAIYRKAQENSNHTEINKGNGFS